MSKFTKKELQKAREQMEHRGVFLPEIAAQLNVDVQTLVQEMKDAGLAATATDKQKQRAATVMARETISVNDMAARMGVTPTVVYKLRQSYAQPTIENLGRAADVSADRAQTHPEGPTYTLGFRQLIDFRGAPGYCTLPAEIWRRVRSVPYATIHVKMPTDCLLFLPSDHPGLTVTTTGSLAFAGGSLMSVEASQALIVPGPAKIRDCKAGFFFAGDFSLGHLMVDRALWADRLYALTDSSSVKMPVSDGCVYCYEIHEIEDICSHEVEYFHRYFRPPQWRSLGENESGVSLSICEERKVGVAKKILTNTRLNVAHVTDRIAKIPHSLLQSNRGVGPIRQ
jgi:hypothetical protein